MFRAVSAFSRGLGFHRKGIRFGFRNPSFLALALLPFVVTLFLYGLGFYFFSIHSEDLLQRFWNPDPAQASSFVGWLHWAYVHVVTVILYALLLVIMFYTFIVISNVIASPVYDRIATRYEATLHPSSEGQIHGAGHGIFAVVKEELKKAAFVLFIPLALVFIPVVGVFLSFVAAAMLITWDYVDYSFSKDVPFFKARLSRVWRHKSLLLGFGLPLVIPFFGLLLLPFAILGATLLYHDTLKAGPSCP